MAGGSVREPARKVPVFAEGDVVVAGGGPGGLAAAIASARAGARTVLIERYGYLGGMATAGLIGPLLGHTAGAGKPVVGGLCREWVERMAALGGAETWEQGLQDWGIRFDPEAFKYVSDRVAEEAGLKLLLHGLVCGAVVKDGALDALILETKQGRLAVRGRVFVDATGDADVAFRAGLETTKGRRFDGRTMAMGSMFRIRGVSPEHAKHAEVIRERIRAGQQSGELRVYGGPGGNGATMSDEELTPNVTRAAGDGTDVEQLTAAELAVRKDTWDIVRFYRERLPGFENVQAGVHASARRRAGDTAGRGGLRHDGAGHHGGAQASGRRGAGQLLDRHTLLHGLHEARLPRLQAGLPRRGRVPHPERGAP